MDSDLLRELACWQTPPCVSIFVPIDPTDPASVDATRVALKSTFRDARHQLQADTTSCREALDGLVASSNVLLETRSGSPNVRGLGLFGAPGFCTAISLDVAVPSLSVVADRFVAAPLVAALPTEDRFFLLTLSHNRVRFLRGDRQCLTVVAVPDLPASRADAVWYEHHERHGNLHGGAHQGSDLIIGTRHGAPSSHDLHKEQLLRYFRAVDRALWSVLRADVAPLLVVGVEYELALYRQANHYTHLAGSVDVGNTERLDLDELHAKVWPIAARTLDRARRELIDRAVSSPTTVTSMPAVLCACREGRVAALFVQPDRLTWGCVDPAEVHPDRRPGDIELVSAAICAALQRGASIHMAGKHELPDDPAVAALLRY